MASPVPIPALIGLPTPAWPVAAPAPDGALRAALARKPRLLGFVAPGFVSFRRTGVARPAQAPQGAAAPCGPSAPA